MRRARWRRFGVWVVLAVGLGILAVHPTVRALWRGEIGLDGRRVFVPPHGADPRALAEIDLDAVHRELLPAWAVAARRARPGDGIDERRAFHRLLAAVGPDANLAAILLELRPVVLAGDPDAAGRALYLSWAWGDYLRRHGRPWWVQAGIARRRDDGMALQLSTYRVQHVTDVRVGAASHEVRLLARADDTGLREAWLGATRRGDEFAAVVLDRVADFAIEDLWPLLLPDADEALPPAARRWAAAIRREAADALAPWQLEVLVAAAPARRAVQTVVRDVRQRRECAPKKLLRRVTWSGQSDAELARLARIARAEADLRCPSIAEAEVHRLAAAATDLRAHPRLAEAVPALIAWAAQHVVIHEARHLADRDAVGNLDTPLPCRSCPESMSSDVRAELSGHLAAIAWAASPATAMYQACLVVARDPDSPHAAAMRLLNLRLSRPCGSGPPADLAPLARGLEREMLGRSTPIALPPAFPTRLALSPAPRR